MGKKRTPLVEDEFYHVYNRGNSKQIIYKDKQDYMHFMYLLYICNTSKKIRVADIERKTHPLDYQKPDKLVSIISYCLMPNHFHILITQQAEAGITSFMRKVLTAYSMYFNKKYSRTGILFEGRFKSSHVDGDRYLKYLFSYIHLNPAKLLDPNWKTSGSIKKDILFKYVSEYPYSSLHSILLPTLKDSVIINFEVFPKYFKNNIDLKLEITSWFYNFSEQVK